MSDAVVLPSGVVLRPLREDDAAAMLDAHLRNREHLAPYEFPRPESFFTLDGQRDRMRSIVAKEQAGEVVCRVMLRGDKVAGFACLTRITPAPLCGADLGYWMLAGQRPLRADPLRRPADGVRAVGGETRTYDIRVCKKEAPQEPPTAADDHRNRAARAHPVFRGR